MSTTPKSAPSTKTWSFNSGSQWNRPPPLGQAPSARCGHSTTKAGTRLYLFGGWSGTKMLSDLYILEPELMRWSRPTTNGKMPRPRAGHTCTAIGPAPQAQSERTAAIQTVNKSSDEASPRRSEEESYYSPRSLSNGASSLSSSSNSNYVSASHVYDDAAGSSAETSGNIVPQPSQRLLFFGGGDNEGFMNDLHLLEIDTLTWSPVYTAGSSPSPRSRHSATLVKSTLWVIGGLGEGQNVFNDVYTLNTTSLVWSKPALKGNPMSPRWGHSAIRSGSLIIIFGGHNGVEVMSDLHILDTDSGSWRSIEPNGAPSLSASGPVCTPLPIPLVELPPVAETEGESSSSSSPSSVGSSLSSSTATSSGGPSVASHSTASVSSTNPTPNNGSNGATPLMAVSAPTQTLTGPPVVPTPRCGHSANFVLLGRERKMVVFGGSNTGGDVFNDTFVLDLDTFVWSALNIQGSLPNARSVHSCNTVEDKLFVIGGIDSVRRFKDIYTLSLSSVIQPAEDPAMAPLRSSGRPRRSSRASPRIVSLSSPTSTSSPTSASIVSNTTTVSGLTPLPMSGLAAAAAASSLSASGSSIPMSPTSYSTPMHHNVATTNQQLTATPTGAMGMGLSHASPHLHPNPTPSGGAHGNHATQPITPNSAFSAPSGGNQALNGLNHPQGTFGMPFPLQTRRSNEDLMRASDSHALANAGPLSVHIPTNHMEVLEDGRLSPLAAYASTNGSHSSPLRQRPGNNLRRSGNGSLGPAFSPAGASIPPSFMAPPIPSVLHTTPAFAESPHSMPIQSYDALSQIRYNKSASSSMESLPSLSPMAIFLSNIGLSRLIPKFEAEEIDMAVLPYLTEENMEFLGVNTLGARLRLSNAIQTLKSPLNNSSKSTSNTLHLPQYGSQSPSAALQPGTEPLEAAVERLVSTVLVATNTLTDTMHFITTKLNNAQPLSTTSPAPHTPQKTIAS